MQSDTRDKLGEAVYFGKQMKVAFESNQADYIYLMNAFISAARSVTFVMQKEYAHAEGFKDWWENNNTKKSQSFSNFNALRTVTEHQKMISQSGRVWGATFNFGEGLQSKDGIVKAGFNFEGGQPTAHVYVTDEDGTEREVPGVASVVRQDIVITEYHDDRKEEVKIESFLAEAEKYLIAVEAIVNECEANFGTRAA
jgi:hypothetical protein